MTKQQSKRGGVKKWAVCFRLNEDCLSGDVQTFQARIDAEDYVHNLHCEAGGFEGDHHIIPVLITPIIKKAKRK